MLVLVDYIAIDIKGGMKAPSPLEAPMDKETVDKITFKWSTLLS